MSRGALVTAAALTVAVSACARPDVPTTPAPPRYQVSGTVIDGPQRGPELCFVVQESNPPSCTGLPIDGWSWDGLPHEDLLGTQHGSYLITGTFDGERITVTEPPRPGKPAGSPVRFPEPTTPCPAPPGGWAPVNPATATEAAFDSALEHAAKAPDYAGAWVDILDPDAPKHSVLNIRFTGDLATHERELRRMYGGALCLSKGERTWAEAERIAREVGERTGVITSLASEINGRVQAEVYIADPALQTELDKTYGPGVVTLHGHFTPVS